MKENIEIIWNHKKFNDLTPEELYHIMELRNRIFVVEQQCVYNDTDLRDLSCIHLFSYSDKALVAYARIVPPGISYNEPSIGRVACDPTFRRKGLGTELMYKAIALTRTLYPDQSIKISAQSYLIDFYRKMGFQLNSEEYLEDGIPHVEMIL